MSNRDDALAELGERLRMIQETLDETLADPSKPELERYMELGQSVHPAAPWATSYNEALEKWRANRTTLFELISSATDSLAQSRQQLDAINASTARIGETVGSFARRPSAAAPLWVTNVLLLFILWRVW